MKKTQNQNKVMSKTTAMDDFKKLIILIIIIAAVLISIYFITKTFEKKDYTSIFNNSLETTEIQYQEILVGTIFDQGDKEYYVLVIDDKNPYTSIFENYVKTYREAKHKTIMYTIDLNNIFNKNVRADKSDYRKGKLKFKSTTLLKIKNKEIIEHIDDSEKINDKFVELNKES